MYWFYYTSDQFGCSCVIQGRPGSKQDVSRGHHPPSGLVFLGLSKS